MDIDYDDHATFQATLRNWPCRHCGHAGVIAILQENGDHFGAVLCNNPNGECGQWVSWLPWPPKTISGKTRRRSRALIKLDEDRCHACGRTRAQAQLMGTTLEAHHLIDRAALIESGLAPDALEHLAWACKTPCHGILTSLRNGFAFIATMLNLEAALAEEAALPVERDP